MPRDRGHTTSRLHRLALAAGVVVLAPSACTVGSGATSWEDAVGVRERAARGGYVAAAYSATPIDKGWRQRGELALVRTDGSVDVLDVGWLEGGTVAPGTDGALAVFSDEATYVLDGDDSRRWERDRNGQSQAWAGTTRGGWSVGVFDGGATSRVVGVSGDRRVVRELDATPWVAGTSDDVVWVMSMPTLDGDARIDRVTLDGRAPTQVRWRYPDADLAETSAASDLFWSGDALWQLESVTPLDDDGGYRLDRVTPRLARVDPTAVAPAVPYTPVTLDGAASYRPLGGVDDRVVGTAARAGHLHEGALHTVDGAGVLWRADLDTADMTAVGELARTEDLDWAVADWREDRLTVLGGPFGGTPRLQTYDLSTGRLVASRDLPELAPHVEGRGGLLTWSVATLGPAT